MKERGIYMRKVYVFKNDKKNELIGIGKFHQWGWDSIEMREGSCPIWTVAIVEFEDGSVGPFNPTQIQFAESEE
jgi:hypothetical protein